MLHNSFTYHHFWFKKLQFGRPNFGLKSRTMKNLICIITFGCLISFGIQAQEETAKTKFYAGIVAEEIDGDLEKAISIYQDILNSEKRDRQISAKCLYHIGLCYDKMESGKAMDIFVELLEKYPDQGDLASLARNQIDKLEDANTFIDPRDGHKYKWVEIGNQTWMAENLAYMPHVNPPKKQEYGIWVYDYEGHDVAAAKATENYQKYGCLYDWTTAMDIDPKFLAGHWEGDSENHQGLCPPGWRMPRDEDWTKIEVMLGLDPAYDKNASEWDLGYRTACGGLKLKSTRGWLSGGNGTNYLGLSMNPGGYRQNDENKLSSQHHTGLGETGQYWTTFEYKDSLSNPPRKGFMQNPKYDMAFYRSLSNWTEGKSDDNIYRGWVDKVSGFSIRCIKSHSNSGNTKLISYTEEARTKSVQSQPIEPNYVSIIPELLKIIPKDQTNRNIRSVDPISKDTLFFPTYTHSEIIDNRLIYSTSSDSTISAFDILSYKKLWEKKYFVSGGFKINGDTIVFSNSESILSVNTIDGKKISSHPFPEAYVLDLMDNQRIIVQPKSGRRSIFECIDYSTGKKVWEFYLSDSSKFSKPVFDETKMYFGVTRNVQNFNNPVDPKNPTFLALNKSNGEIEWRFGQGNKASHREPLLYDNNIIFMDYIDQYVYSLDKKNGRASWSYYMDHRGSSPLIQKPSGIYFNDNRFFWGNSQVYKIDHSGKEIWKKKLLENLSPTEIYSISGDDHILLTISNSLESYLMFIDHEVDQPNYMIELPQKSLGLIRFYKDKIIIPTQTGIFFYKYPDFKE